MISAPEKFGRDFHDISAKKRAAWHVTAELNEMVQYCHSHGTSGFRSKVGLMHDATISHDIRDN
jgi:hypothetical protein